jgi:hypothetical protein
LKFGEARQSIDERIAFVHDLCGGKPRPFTWDLSRTLTTESKMPGSLKVMFQLIGDCVACSTAKTLQALSVIETAVERQEEKVWTPNPSWIYGVGRNFVAESKIPTGRDGSNDGMLGVWAAETVNKHGVLFEEMPGSVPYSDATTRWVNYQFWRNDHADWYKKYKPMATPHTVTIVRCNSWSDCVKVFKANGVCTIASNWGFRMENYRDRHIYRRGRDPWWHQMYATDFEESASFTGWYRLNQWGEVDTIVPKNGEIRGGAWQLAEDVDTEIKSGNQEVYGYLCLQGVDDAPNWSII